MITCPECLQPIQNDDIQHIQQCIESTRGIQCDLCGRMFKLPDILSFLKTPMCAVCFHNFCMQQGILTQPRQRNQYPRIKIPMFYYVLVERLNLVKFLSFHEDSPLFVFDFRSRNWRVHGKDALEKMYAFLEPHNFRTENLSRLIKYVVAKSRQYRNVDNLGTPSYLSPLPLHLIPVRNGYLDISGGSTKLIDSSSPLAEVIDSNHFSLNRIPTEYKIFTEDEIKESLAYQFLESITKDQNDLKTLIQVGGYCLYRAVPIQRFFLLYGDGSNGKSTYLEFLRETLGIHNVSSISLQQLANPSERFKIAELYGKLCNIVGDLPSTIVQDVGMIKQLTGEDMITGERKYGPNFNFISYAKMIFSTNYLPRVSKLDFNSYAWWRRMILIEFPHRFEENPDFRHQLMGKRELEVFLYLAVNELVDLLRTKKFASFMAHDYMKILSYKSWNVNFFDFLLDYFEITGNENDWILFSDLYDLYSMWCDKNGEEKYSKQKIGRMLGKIESIRREYIKINSGGRDAAIYRGIRYKG